VSRDKTNEISGLFIYDNTEKGGTIFTRSREVFDHFFGLKDSGFIFAEIQTEHACEAYNIYNIDLEGSTVDHRFSHEISISEEEDAQELEQFMAHTDPVMNRQWVRVALGHGEKCLFVRLEKEIAGLGWVSFVEGAGRLHSLFVNPRFRSLGIGEDILFARLLWLKSKHARRAFSEISRNNVPSTRIAIKGGMQVSGQIYQYFIKGPGRKTERLSVVS